MLKIIGIGLDDREITLKGLEALKQADQAYIELYTNTSTVDVEKLERRSGKNIRRLSREQVEQKDKLVDAAEQKEVAFLVSGDPLSATTHYGIKHRAEQRGIETRVFHAPSIFTSVAETGLNIYKFGRTVTLPENSVPGSVLEYIEKNDSVGLHTLVLLDIDLKASTAAEKLIENGVSGDRLAVVLERANSESQNVSAGKLEQLAGEAFRRPPHSILLAGETSHKEEQFLEDHG